MLSKLRNFSKSRFAPILVGIIIIPFLFWGMGGVFSGGNTNSIAKINKYNLSTEDFIDYINSLNLDKEIIKDNIDNGSIEELLSQLISIKILDLEIKDLNLSISENSLAKRITNNKTFFDEKNKFSRIKYEKFLLLNNITAVDYEQKLKKNEKKKKLFSYISGGIKTPSFLIDQVFKNQNKKINIKYINLNKVYKNEFSNEEMNLFISENKNSLYRELINSTYVKLSPNNLIQSNDYNDQFFQKIDEIENLIFKGASINEIKNTYNLKFTNINEFYLKDDENDEILKEIYINRNADKINLIDKNEYFLLYEIKEIKKVLPSITDIVFLNKVKKLMFIKEKNKLHQDLLKKIQNKKMSDDYFIKISKNNDLIKEDQISSADDKSLFETKSIDLIYSLPKNSYILAADDDTNIYIVKIIDFINNSFIKNEDERNTYEFISNGKLSNDLYSSYDLYLNTKYEVELNENTLERVKNYFK
tara:strand:- start:2540 stop:3964 length:1425 start_codon:yes stop_codon:yes gene_type:complete